jgi:acetyl-CoA carboxylase biotin carboxylase subunit
MFEGYRIPPYYDSLLAKVIAWGQDRAEACARMRRALSEMTLEGIHTTIPFHLRLLADERFVRGDVHTRFVEDELMRAA